jgi:hypothetical protein
MTFISVKIPNDGNVFAGEKFHCLISISNTTKPEQSGERGRAFSTTSKAISRRTSGFFTSPQSGDLTLFSASDDVLTWEAISPPKGSSLRPLQKRQSSIMKSTTKSSIIAEERELEESFSASPEKILDMGQYEPAKTESSMLPPLYEGPPKYAPLSQQSSNGSLFTKNIKSRANSVSSLLTDHLNSRSSTPGLSRPPALNTNKPGETKSEYILYTFAQMSGKIHLDSNLMKTTQFESLRNLALFQNVSYSDPGKSKQAGNRNGQFILV